MRILFPYPRQFGYFPDIFEYVTLLRERGLEAYYVGINQGQSETDQPPFAIHFPHKDVSTKDFVRFVGQQATNIKPDIVHAFHFRGCGILPLLARNSVNKWIVDVRTIHVETQDLKITSDFWLRDRLTWLETQTYDHIFALTHTIQQKLNPSLRPIEIIPLGASFSRLNLADKDLVCRDIRNQLNIPMDAPVLLYAGSLSPTRRLDKIMGGFALTLEQFPNAKFVVVGGELGYDPHTDPLINSLVQLAKKLGVSANVLFTGRVPYADIPNYFAMADVGISYMPLGTPHQYQPPTKLIEYMMAGMIAASNKIPAIDELVEDNVNGILFGETEEEIANGLRRSLDLLNPDNQDIYLQMTTNSQTAVLDRDWQHIVDERLIPQYEKLSGSKN